jgi:hypothetical protein
MSFIGPLLVYQLLDAANPMAEIHAADHRSQPSHEGGRNATTRPVHGQINRLERGFTLYISQNCADIQAASKHLGTIPCPFS